MNTSLVINIVICYLKKDALIPLIKKSIPILLLAYVFSWAVSINIPGYYVNIAMGVLLPFLVIGGGIFASEDSIFVRFKLRDIPIPLDCT